MTNEEILTEIKKRPADKKELVELLYGQNAALLRKLASPYARCQDNEEDLFQAACIGLLEAVERYDPGRGVKFSTYAVPWIRQSIRQCAELSSGIPVSVYRKACQARAAERSLQSETGRPPTDAEVAERLSTSLDELQRIRAWSHQCASLDAPLDPEDGGGTLLDALPGSGSPENEVAEKLCGAEINEAVSSRPEWRVIRRCAIDGLTVAQFARESGMTYGRARALYQKACRQIRLNKKLMTALGYSERSFFRGSFSSFERSWCSSVEKAALERLESEKLHGSM